MSADVPAIYLCSVDHIAGPGEDVQKQTTLLAQILEKLGYVLISDKEHHHLWAAGPADLLAATAPSQQRPVWSGLLEPADFERRFLAWIHINTGVLPEASPGTTGQWTFAFQGLPVTFTITPHETLKWTLTIEETEPCPFVDAVAPHFAEGLSIPFHLAGGRIRWRFVSGWLIREFEDQTEWTN